ncbi:hypothetical protein B9Z55_009257 [Caenorhabditis nigoni]|nr:hypothetical protein B9Z55_009257 [Caenorhabditis nigoni]
MTQLLIITCSSETTKGKLEQGSLPKLSRTETIKVEDASFSHSILCTGTCPSPRGPQLLLLFLHANRRRRSFIRESETVTSI